MLLKMRVMTVLIVAGAFLAPCAGAGERPVPTTQREKVSYAVGVEIARSMKQQGAEVETGPVVEGLRDVLAGEKLLMSDEDIRKHLGLFHNEMRRKQNQMKQRRTQIPPKTTEESK